MIAFALSNKTNIANLKQTNAFPTHNWNGDDIPISPCAYLTYVNKFLSDMDVLRLQGGEGQFLPSLGKKVLTGGGDVPIYLSNQRF